MEPLFKTNHLSGSHLQPFMFMYLHKLRYREATSAQGPLKGLPGAKRYNTILFKSFLGGGVVLFFKIQIVFWFSIPKLSFIVRRRWRAENVIDLTQSVCGDPSLESRDILSSRGQFECRGRSADFFSFAFLKDIPHFNTQHSKLYRKKRDFHW